MHSCIILGIVCWVPQLRATGLSCSKSGYNTNGGWRTALNVGWNHLEHTRIAIAFACWNFLLILSLKTIKNFSGQMRQLYAYVANESTWRLVENGMSTGLTNTHMAHGFSVLYHMFAHKQYILCSALCHKSYLTLPYVTMYIA